MGLNEPFLARYAQWLGNALTGDLGTSYKDGMPVAGKLTHALRYTLILSVASLAVSLIVSLPLAVISAVKKDGILDNIVKLLSFIGNSLPNFLISVLLMYFFLRQDRPSAGPCRRKRKGAYPPLPCFGNTDVFRAF